MSSMADPSYGVHKDLLPHVHLLSTYRYTVKQRIEIPEVTNYLLQAPKITRDTAPFYWTYLDRPENGSIFLTWQPLQLMGTEFASDGYIWGPPEMVYQQDVGNGLVLEMYYLKSGFAYGDQFATHSRRRFRLVPKANNGPNPTQVDPSLWIVHYGPVDNNERIPVNMIPQDQRTQNILQTRVYLHRCGQIQRKEFILNDRINWPQIAWPRDSAPRQNVHAGNPRGIPQSMAYPPQAAHTGPPSKRARTAQAAPVQPPAGVGAIPQLEYDEEEDTSRGDLFDHLTPREVSLARYKQNHEWMEEILSSPYRMGQIQFADLGFGLKGELAGLTEGIFEAHTSDTITKESSSKTTAVTALDKDNAEEFRKRVNQRIEATNSEIDQLKAKHAKLVAKLKKNSLITVAEKDLRTAAESENSELAHVIAHNENSEEDAGRWSHRHIKKVDDIVSQVEASLGRRAEVIHDIKRIQDGGYQEPAPEPVQEEPKPLQPAITDGQPAGPNLSATLSPQASQTESTHSGLMGDSDIDMGGTAAGLLDQMHTGLSSNATPVNHFPTPDPHLSAVQSTANTPANMNVGSPHPTAPQTELPAVKEDEGEDVNMAGTEPSDGTALNTAPDQGTGSGDWVVVPKGGVTPESTANPPSNTEAVKSQPASKQASAAGTPAVGDSGSLNFEGDHNDFSSLGDLDTAGDALASFDGTGGDLGDGLDLHMDMEDSAFGDAFHGVESGNGEDNSAEGNL